MAVHQRGASSLPAQTRVNLGRHGGARDLAGNVPVAARRATSTKGEAVPAWGHTRWWYTFAASVVLVVLVAGTLMYSQLDSRLLEPRQTLATIAGQQTNHVLPDGSHILLNTRSRVEVDFNRHARIVRVYEGEVGSM